MIVGANIDIHAAFRGSLPFWQVNGAADGVGDQQGQINVIISRFAWQEICLIGLPLGAFLTIVTLVEINSPAPIGIRDLPCGVGIGWQGYGVFGSICVGWYGHPCTVSRVSIHKIDVEREPVNWCKLIIGQADRAADGVGGYQGKVDGVVVRAACQ